MRPLATYLNAPLMRYFTFLGTIATHDRGVLRSFRLKDRTDAVVPASVPRVLPI